MAGVPARLSKSADAWKLLQGVVRKPSLDGLELSGQPTSLCTGVFVQTTWCGAAQGGGLGKESFGRGFEQVWHSFLEHFRK